MREWTLEVLCPALAEFTGPVTFVELAEVLDCKPNIFAARVALAPSLLRSTPECVWDHDLQKLCRGTYLELTTQGRLCYNTHRGIVAWRTPKGLS